MAPSSRLAALLPGARARFAALEPYPRWVLLTLGLWLECSPDRKELVYGEDYEERAQPQTLKELFSNVRKNYFRLYFHYAYFNLVSTWYAQLDVLFSLIVLFPSIAAGTMTLGLLNQIGNVFDKVRESFQYLVSSWKTIIELLSIYKRLKAFEAVLKD